MPTVPTYQDTQQHVALRPEYTEGFTVKADSEATRSSMSTLLDSTIRHTFDQRKAWFAETSQKSIKSSAEDAVAVYDDPAKVADAIHKGITEIEHQGRMQGWSKEKLARESAQY